MSPAFRQPFSQPNHPLPQAKFLRQRGIAIMLIVFLIAFGATAYLVVSLNANSAKVERDTQTTAVLAEAKAALIAYAMAVDTTPGACTTNCPRPGDLPCPDTNDDGNAEANCGNAAGTTQQANRLGRLPWKTLNLPELRDGNGEHLWYAVSSNFKQNTRFRPLNSDSNGTITVRDSNGNIVNDATGVTGAVAVVISSGKAVTRQDDISQSRGGANLNAPVHYLDNALGEDNAAFIDGGADGFISGPVFDANGKEILNDRLLTISHDEIFAVIEQRVATEVMNALVDYYCGGFANANYATNACNGLGGNRFFPRPALFTDNTCLGNAALANCGSDAAATHGRIPANPNTAWSATSILRGTANNNWFQLNGWRELIHYAVAAPCADGTIDCGGGAGNLTLNNALVLPNNNKKAIITSAGKTLGAQTRANNADKSLEQNYLEDENVLPLDDTYTRTVGAGVLFNDFSVSIQ